VCSHYQALKARAEYEKFGALLPPDWSAPVNLHIYKGYAAPFIRRPKEVDSGDEAVPEREAVAGEFGLIPHWSKERKIKFSTLNARSETAATAASYRLPWQERHCIIPADWFNEPDWRSGKAVDTRIQRADGEPVGIAGLWDAWRDKVTGEIVRSFTMLTVNADNHPLMRQFHKPGDEKRMLVILPEAQYGEWLQAPPERSMAFMRQYPASKLVAEPVVKKPVDR
jgi:putative SOS response-associated peptidase YedK